MSNAERQRLLNDRRREAGLVPVTVWVPAHVAVDFRVAADRCCADRNLTIGRLVNLVTGTVAGLLKGGGNGK